MNNPNLNSSLSDLLHLKIPQFRYGSNLIFGDITLDLVLNGWTGLVGRSGVGKTTLIRCLSGLERLRMPLRTVLMTQHDQLLPWKTVIENIILSDVLQRKKPDYNHAQNLLHMMGLEEHEKMLPQALSAGMRQRVALARSLYQEADLVLLDEPFSALDALTREQLYPLIVEALRGRTVLIVSHDPQEIIRLSHRVYLMSGKPAHLRCLEYPLYDETPRFLNQPLVNQYAADLIEQLHKELP